MRRRRRRRWARRRRACSSWRARRPRRPRRAARPGSPQAPAARSTGPCGCAPRPVRAARAAAPLAPGLCESAGRVCMRGRASMQSWSMPAATSSPGAPRCTAGRRAAQPRAVCTPDTRMPVCRAAGSTRPPARLVTRSQADRAPVTRSSAAVASLCCGPDALGRAARSWTMTRPTTGWPYSCRWPRRARLSGPRSPASSRGACCARRARRPRPRAAAAGRRRSRCRPALAAACQHPAPGPAVR